MTDLADQIAQQYQAQMGFAPSAGVLDYFVNSIGNQGATFADLGNTLQAAGGSAYSGGAAPQSAGAGSGGTAVSSGGGGTVAPPPVVTPPPPSSGSGGGWNDLSNQISSVYQNSMGKAINPGTLAYFANDLGSGRASWADLNNTLQAAGGKPFDQASLGYGAAPTAADKAPSTPYLADMVTQAYRQATGKDPAPGVLDYFVRDLASGKANWSDLNNTLTAFTGGKGFDPASFGYGKVPNFQAVNKGQSRASLQAQIAQLQQQLAQLQAKIADLKAKIAAKKAAGGGAASPLLAGAGAGAGAGAASLGAPVTNTSGGPTLGGLASLAVTQPGINGPVPMTAPQQSNVAI